MSAMEKKLSRAEQKARRPHEILDAAFEEFVEKGYAATRVEDVAARLGVTKGTVYLYFPTKEALFEATIGHVSAPFEDVRASIDALQGSHSDRLRQLLLLGYDKLSGDRKTRELLRLQLAEGSRFPNIIDRHYSEFIAPLLDAVRALIEQGVASGEFHQGAAASIPEVVISSAVHLTIWKLIFADRNPIDEATFIEAHIDLVLNGLLARRR
ncbi:MAG: TetR/AcrR family transcriptional regulator [Mesorhizobium sp.]|uniref:TetR/AcrR family transcriptional regulator n=1 Tax=Mesorhizobium sp. TaxID=1871066 RepID=UPI000FE6AD4C|nr:TetR/AcrR family transcriptional regulator [Mesorhizobium sp.]RWM98763.1 MAG: TetR/AcrR family transcriptional regulator [Mesorhizobium sp.]